MIGLNEAAFTIRGISGSQSDLLGIWAPRSPVTMAFGVGDQAAPGEITQEDEIVWSVSLPNNPGLANAIVTERAQAVGASQQNLTQAREMLRTLPGQGVEAAAFALADTAERPSPEIMLQRRLAALHDTGEAVSFGLTWSTDWSSALADYQTFVQQAMQVLKPTLCVETQVAEAVLAFTRVRFSGDIDTCWADPCSAHYISLHHHVLSLTLESRLALLQLLAQTAAGAAMLAVRFSLPGGALTALPATWRYLQDVMAQGQRVRDLQRQLDPR
jgi:hypothetical protein